MLNGMGDGGSTMAEQSQSRSQVHADDMDVAPAARRVQAENTQTSQAPSNPLSDVHRKSAEALGLLNTTAEVAFQSLGQQRSLASSPMREFAVGNAGAILSRAAEFQIAAVDRDLLSTVKKSIADLKGAVARGNVSEAEARELFIALTTSVVGGLPSLQNVNVEEAKEVFNTIVEGAIEEAVVQYERQIRRQERAVNGE
ncbi:MAG: hypothetical protein GY915_04775, partial [bacterium]|nr:hypothetical protein [bacterium]